MGSDRQGSATPPPLIAAKRRIPLGRSPKRLSFERRLRLWAWCFSLPLLLLVLRECRAAQLSPLTTVALLAAAILFWAAISSYFQQQVTRPLQTLSNIVAALREDDFSFRARGAMRGDALGDLALEINILAGSLQANRVAAMDALTLTDRIISSMQSPVLAFDDQGQLRLLNTAAQQHFGLNEPGSIGRNAQELAMEDLMGVADQSVITPERSRNAHTGLAPRWSVRKSVFRLNGVPHTLLVLSDVAAALREEERSAWQRLIRVMSHEINNSLTPIKSVASMLRSRPLRLSTEHHTSQDLYDLRRGLAMIEDRADSLNRFLQAYQQLSRLPPPRMRPVSIATAVEQGALLEHRVPIHVDASQDLQVQADPDQLQQLLINIFKNAGEAAIEAAADGEPGATDPLVEVSWRAQDGMVALQAVDNGPGLANPANLFVPFYTTKPEGTGIGLTLCQQIVAGHHGSIHLWNRSDRSGCIVEVRLPRAFTPFPESADKDS